MSRTKTILSPSRTLYPVTQMPSPVLDVHGYILEDVWYDCYGNVAPLQGPYDKKYMNKKGYALGIQLLEAGKLLEQELKSCSDYSFYTERLAHALQHDFHSTTGQTDARTPFWGGALQVVEKHGNGGLALTDFSSERYHKLPNDLKRNYYYKVSKLVDAKSGKLYQNVKAYTKPGGKIMRITKPLGVVGGVMTGTVAIGEFNSGRWSTHTVINSVLLGVVVTSAFFTVSPAVLFGIAVYGILDYCFDIGEGIDLLYDINSNRRPLW